MQQRLAEFERLLIRVLLGLGENGYGMTIRRESERAARRPVTLGSVYWVLDRLEQRGLVSSYYANPTAIRGGRPRRYFQVARKGESPTIPGATSRDWQLIQVRQVP